MRRKKKIQREINPDPKFGNITVAKFINQIMRKGKKSIAQKIVYSAFQKLKEDPLKTFEQAIKNAGPQVEVISRRIGGANYQIPKDVRSERRTALAIRWLIDAARKKKGKPMAERLAGELLDASKNAGAAVAKKQQIYKTAQANKAFAHFAH